MTGRAGVEERSGPGGRERPRRAGGRAPRPAAFPAQTLRLGGVPAGQLVPPRSALKAGGSTRRWRTLRDHFEARLPLPCWRCGRMLGKGDDWHLGHVGLARAQGAGDDQLWPECASCSTSSGGQLGGQMASHGPKRVNGSLPPSREW